MGSTNSNIYKINTFIYLFIYFYYYYFNESAKKPNSNFLCFIWTEEREHLGKELFSAMASLNFVKIFKIFFLSFFRKRKKEKKIAKI
jgi:hypothetical protein